MKRIIYLIALTVLVMTGCKDLINTTNSNQYEKYIFFSQEVNTKAPLIESTGTMQRFGVVGFKYDNTTNWNAYKNTSPAPTPNVFYDQIDNTSPIQYQLVNVETVTCDTEVNGYADGMYAPLQGWVNNKKYTFFAYYPIGKTSVQLVNQNGANYSGGAPAIKYSISDDDATTSANETYESMADVMIAEHVVNNVTVNEDLYWTSSTDNNINNGDITFSFKHCLSSLGVKVKNSSSSQIQLASMTLSVLNILYNQIVIPLDGSTPQKTEASSPMSASLALSLTNDEKAIAAGSNVELADKLMFIPQAANISIHITFAYKRNGETENVVISVPYPDANGNEQYLTTPLVQGTKNLIHLNFKDSSVDVSGVFSSDDWVTIPDVEDTFN